MINNTFRGGLTSRGASATIDYLLNQRVEENQAYILDGNVQLLKQVISDSKNKNKWSSGVLSFSELLSREILEQIKEEWKTAFLCGMKDEQTAGLFVVHIDKGRSEIHYIFAKTELSTGKSFNPYFVLRDKKKKTLFQEYINIKYNLTDPNDKGRESLTRGIKKDWTKYDKKSVLKEIDKHITYHIKNGDINSRDELLAYFRKFGLELADNAKNRKHIAIVNPHNPSKNWRLSGAIYQKDFDFSSIQNGKTLPPPPPPKEQQRRPIETVKKELDYIINANAKYNKERYNYVRDTNSPRADSNSKQQRTDAYISKRNSESISKRIADRRRTRRSETLTVKHLPKLSDRKLLSARKKHARVLLPDNEQHNVQSRTKPDNRVRHAETRVTKTPKPIVKISEKSREKVKSVASKTVPAAKTFTPPKTPPKPQEQEQLTHTDVKTAIDTALATAMDQAEFEALLAKGLSLSVDDMNYEITNTVIYIVEDDFDLKKLNITQSKIEAKLLENRVENTVIKPTGVQGVSKGMEEVFRLIDAEEENTENTLFVPGGIKP